MTDQDWVDFATFWKKYPRKESKRFAVLAFDKALKGGISAQTIINGIDTSPRLKVERQFIPHPSTWIESYGWDDEPLGDSPKTTDADNVLLIPITREEREQNLRHQAKKWSN